MKEEEKEKSEKGNLISIGDFTIHSSTSSLTELKNIILELLNEKVVQEFIRDFEQNKITRSSSYG